MNTTPSDVDEPELLPSLRPLVNAIFTATKHRLRTMPIGQLLDMTGPTPRTRHPQQRIRRPNLDPSPGPTGEIKKFGK